ncbi:MAG: DUF4199 domain-containing protein [Eudoraea sp.]|nr:DUF4199 domain-containing protein [Eudoraea sp.]MBT8323215.1 DUF4199 domain-containing protein [Eudoraea sp.]NNJ37646.1 DUF4199 domain-containing protein [Flavobacteriaceae bacterium]
MEEQQPKTGKFALNYGLLLGAVSVIFTFMLYTLDMHYQQSAGVIIISAVLSLAAIIIGLIQFKKANGGFMSFGQGFKIGVGICLIAGIIGIIFNQIMLNVIDPDMMTKALDFQEQQLVERGLTPQQASDQMEMGKQFATPLWQITFGLIFSILFGILLTIVPALVIKKAKPE